MEPMCSVPVVTDPVISQAVESPSLDPIKVMFEQLLAGLARLENRMDDYDRGRHTLRPDPEPPDSRAPSRSLETPLPFVPPFMAVSVATTHMPMTATAFSRSEGFRVNPTLPTGAPRMGFAQQPSAWDLPPSSRSLPSSWDLPVATRTQHGAQWGAPSASHNPTSWDPWGNRFPDQWGPNEQSSWDLPPTSQGQHASWDRPAATVTAQPQLGFGGPPSRGPHRTTLSETNPWERQGSSCYGNRPRTATSWDNPAFRHEIHDGGHLHAWDGPWGRHDGAGYSEPSREANEYGCYGHGSAHIHFPKLECNLNSYVCGNAREVSKQKREDSDSMSWVTQMEYSYDNARDFVFSECRVAEDDRCDELERVHSTNSIFETKAKEVLVHDVANSDTEDVTILTSDLPVIQDEDVHVSKNQRSNYPGYSDVANSDTEDVHDVANSDTEDVTIPVIGNPTIIGDAPKKSPAPIAMQLKGEVLIFLVNPIMGMNFDSRSFEKNPSAKLPIFQNGSHVLFDTIEIIQYVALLEFLGINRQVMITYLKD
ncbi:hypothetical protein SASPL_148157 [Salvia splendens]|uniref:Uncharacterized protein n=1 Tax=Salvia splendens TaxID=180675 RepID=A0A8X8W9K1_SALSN|nr:hypothetical protein SASPL_148157 [Salvia splendens]